jgi:WD40 repeat protein
MRQAVDTARLTIAPRARAHLPLKPADYTKGRTTPVVAHGAANFAFGNSGGRVNTLSPGGIAAHLPVKASSAISQLAFSPDGASMVFACGDALFVTQSDANAPRLIASLPEISALVFSPDGATLAVGHAGGVSRFATGSFENTPVEAKIAGNPLHLIWHSNGEWLACCLEADGFCLLETATNSLTTRTNFPAPVRSLGFGAPTPSVVASGAFRVAGWSLADHSPIMSGKSGLVLVDAVAACPKRNLVAKGYANGLLSLAVIGGPSEILLREDTGAGFTALAWSANGDFLAVAGTDGSAALIEFPSNMFKS